MTDSDVSTPETRHAAFADCPFGVLTVTEGDVTAINDRAVALLDTTRESVIERPVGEAFPTSVEATVPRAFADGRPEERAFEEYYPELDRWLSVSLVPSGRTTRVFLSDVTERVMAEREVTELRDEIDRVSMIDDLLSDVLVTLVDASTREEVAETICARLGETDLYEFAWLGERDPGSDQLQVRASAGSTGETFEQVTEHLTETPERRAVDRGRVEVIQPIADDRSVPAPIRQAAFADGVQSFLAVPLVYGDTVYGVVGVYAAGQDAFPERARESFETLGAIAGFAVNAARNRNLLFADSVTELTFEVTDLDAPLVAASGALDAEITVEGTVPQEQDRVLCYLTVTSDAEAARDVFTDQDAIETVRVVADHDDHTRMEIELSGPTPLRTVPTLGATVGEATFDGGRGRITAELPSGEEVRRVAEAIRRRFDADTVAKMQRDRSVTTAEDLRTDLADRLTERQHTALRTAFLAGYFQSPRESTAEEVGDALGITGSTLLHHLRAGQRKLLDAFLDTDRGRRPDDPLSGTDR